MKKFSLYPENSDYISSTLEGVEYLGNLKNNNMELKFYKKPFETDWCGLYIHDASYQTTAMFLMDMPQETKERIIDALNSEERIPNKARLTVDPNDSGVILNKGEKFIRIRGWGNLTGTGGHNLSAEEAVKIQDNFRDWIIWKLELNKD